jgi:hypothetical protein
MTPYTKLDKTLVANITILSGILGLACLLIGTVATQYDAEAFANPLKLLTMTNVNVIQIKWFMILDMFGYYLLLLPIIFYTHEKLNIKTALASLFTSLGFAYVLIGAIGAVVLAVIWPDLISKHAGASEEMKEVYKADFLLATNFVVKGLWNYLEVLLCGIWWIAVGYFTIENRALKITTLVLGFACLIDAFGELASIPTMAEIGLNVYLILAIVWPVWIGIEIFKNKY